MPRSRGPANSWHDRGQERWHLPAWPRACRRGAAGDTWHGGQRAGRITQVMLQCVTVWVLIQHCNITRGYRPRPILSRREPKRPTSLSVGRRGSVGEAKTLDFSGPGTETAAELPCKRKLAAGPVSDPEEPNSGAAWGGSQGGTPPADGPRRAQRARGPAAAGTGSAWSAERGRAAGAATASRH